tara:strand:+ start:3832 stop:5037 length:1206 start_codon:yes stop_codon:yes gene_type:complete
MKEKYGTWITGLIIGSIVFVFVFLGVFQPDTSMQGGIAGRVNGEVISLSEFQRTFEQRAAFFKNLSGGLTEEQIKRFRLRESVLEELALKKLAVEEGIEMGLVPSDEEVREQILQIEVFQSEGPFDTEKYKQVLQANGYTPASFEKAIRSDLVMKQFENYFQNSVSVSDLEVQNEFAVKKDRRKVRFVHLTADNSRSAIPVTSAEVKKYLENKDQKQTAMNRFELQKETRFKGKNFDDVKNEIVKDLIRSSDREKIKVYIESTAQQVAALMKKNSAKKEIDRILAPLKTVKVQEMELTRVNAGLPGVGEVDAYLKDVFSKDHVLNLKKGGAPKIYPLGAGEDRLIGVVLESFEPNYSDLNLEEKFKIKDHLKRRKVAALRDQLMNRLKKSAVIEKNPQLFD